MAHIGDKPPTIDAPATYRITLQGALDDSWRDSLGNMQIQVKTEESGHAVTTLIGPVVDQAALAGILNLAYDLGMPLLSVERLKE